MAYPYIPSGQNMKKESSDKLVCLERHGLLAVILCIISPSKGNIAVLDGEDAVIADGDPMGISAEVLKYPLGAIEGRFAIDDPLLMVELSSEGVEVAGILEMTDTAGECELSPFEVIIEEVKELASEQRRHDPNGK